MRALIVVVLVADQFRADYVTQYSDMWTAGLKEILTKGAAFTEIDIEKKPEARAEMIQKAKGRSTVPQIFIGEKHVGGCDDLYALDDRGQLEPLLQA